MVIREEMGFWKSWIEEPFPSPPEDSAVQKSEKPGKPQGALLAVHTECRLQDGQQVTSSHQDTRHCVGRGAPLSGHIGGNM